MAWLSNVVSLKRFRCSGQGLFYLAQMGLGREVPLSLRSPLRLSPPAMAMGPRVNNEIPELTFDYLPYLLPTYLTCTLGRTKGIARQLESFSTILRSFALRNAGAHHIGNLGGR